MGRVFGILIFGLLLLLITVQVALAQGPPPPPPFNEVPLDGFSALLLAAGAGYGARKLLRKGTHDDQSRQL